MISGVYQTMVASSGATNYITTNTSGYSNPFVTPPGPTNEFIPLSTALASPGPAFIYYYPAVAANQYYNPPSSAIGSNGQPSGPGGTYWIPLNVKPGASGAPAVGSTVYIQALTRSFSCGDSSLRLTTPLPEVSMTATAVAGQYVLAIPTPALIGRVDGVFTSSSLTGTNYYSGAQSVPTNPYTTGDTLIRLSAPLSGTVYIAYVPLNRSVYLSYSDISFTHQVRGTAVDAILPDGMTLSWAQGVSYFMPDGWSVPNVHMRGNTTDVTAGTVGIWLNSDLSQTNYFNPRWTSRYMDITSGTDIIPATEDNRPATIIAASVPQGQLPAAGSGVSMGTLRLSTLAPTGTNYMYARYYQYRRLPYRQVEPERSVHYKSGAACGDQPPGVLLLRNKDAAVADGKHASNSVATDNEWEGCGQLGIQPS